MADFKHISINDTAKLLADNAAMICDIRDPNAFNAGHIEGAFHLNDGTMAQLLDSVDFETTLVVVCYHGHSSQGAAQYLTQQGYQKVYSMDGGFEQWKKEQPSVTA